VTPTSFQLIMPSSTPYIYTRMLNMPYTDYIHNYNHVQLWSNMNTVITRDLPQ